MISLFNNTHARSDIKDINLYWDLPWYLSESIGRGEFGQFGESSVIC